MKKTYFLLTYIIFSILLINIKPTESTLMVNSEHNTLDEYSQNYYLLTFKDINFLDLLTYLDNDEIYILEITPITYKNINTTLHAKGMKVTDIYQNFIKEYTSILKEKGYTEEALYIEQKGISVKNLKVLALQKNIDDLKKHITFEYTLENST